MSDTWRRKIKLVPTRTECQKNWTCSATKLLSLSLKDRKVALLLRHCTCIQIFTIQAYLTDHLALLCPSPVQLDQLTPWSTRGHHDLSSPFHPATTSSPKGGSSKELLINNPVAVQCTLVAGAHGGWCLTGGWRAPPRPNEQARHSTGKIPARPPSFPPL